jgi:cysteine desulfurase
LGIHYLDNSATTSVCRRASQRMKDYMDSCFGNPSSLHGLGIDAQVRYEDCVRTIAGEFGCDEREIYLTSCGTESNNTAVFGAVGALRRRGNRIVTTAVEHHSVLLPMQELEKRGFDVVYLSPDKDGKFTDEAIAGAVTPDTILVSMMAVNNETGAVLPVSRLRAAVRAAGSEALIHCDAVQALGKIDISPDRLGADLVSVSAHKIHGPKGIGALYIRRGCRIVPLMFGGGQGRGMRPGTESTLLAEGFAGAVEALPDKKSALERAAALRGRLISGLKELSGVTVNSPEDALPYVVNFSVGGVRSETMLHFLEQRQVYVSSGSACAKGEQSHVLSAYGLSRGLSDSAIRASFSYDSTEEDVDALLDGVKAGLLTLKRRK